jgi:hypothetical protein
MTAVTVGIAATIGTKIIVMIVPLLKAVVLVVLLQEGGVAVDDDAVALPHGLTSYAKSATKKATRPRHSGGFLKMVTSSMTRRLTWLPMAWIPTGTPILVQQTISQASSII